MLALVFLVVPARSLEAGPSMMEAPPVFVPPPPISDDDPMVPPPQDPQDLIVEYEVRPGDTLSGIAAAFNADAESLAVINKMTNWHRLQPGDVVRIPSVPGLLHEVAEGETLEQIADRFDVDLDEVLAANYLQSSDDLEAGSELILPGVRPDEDAILATRSEPVQPFIWPTYGRITSYYGPRWGGFHQGIDIATRIGTPVVASRGGRVTFAGWQGAYGNLIIIDHGGGASTYYAHLNSIGVGGGQVVAQGATIGSVGSTGRSTGPHLHFEVRVHGTTQNPLNHLP